MVSRDLYQQYNQHTNLAAAHTQISRIRELSKILVNASVGDCPVFTHPRFSKFLFVLQLRLPKSTRPSLNAVVISVTH